MQQYSSQSPNYLSTSPNIHNLYLTSTALQSFMANNPQMYWTLTFISQHHNLWFPNLRTLQLPKRWQLDPQHKPFLPITQKMAAPILVTLMAILYYISLSELGSLE
jgi:hypothetical protein